MAITLCFDLGNTRAKMAVFENANFKEEVVLTDLEPQTIAQYITHYQPSFSILSSVIHHPAHVEEILAASTTFHKLDHTSKLPLTTPVGKPETIGADRLALVAAAVHLFPDNHNLVIALGSCITYNFINNRSEFLGGGISPGMKMRFRAMHEHTALLPIIEAAHDFPLVGYDTRTNLLSGVILGISKEIDGIIDAYSEKYGNFNVLLTGGDMPFFVPHLKNRIFADQNLIYKGLYAICEFNNR
jgi:type III pantothenate kinase